MAGCTTVSLDSAQFSLYPISLTHQWLALSNRVNPHRHPYPTLTHTVSAILLFQLTHL